SGHLGQQRHRAIQILGVLADDRDRERVAVLDQHFAVAIEEHAARRPQRKRALVVVLGHLLVLRALNDLNHPETDAERGKHTMAATCRMTSRVPIRRRSSATAILSASTFAPLCGVPSPPGTLPPR